MNIGTLSNGRSGASRRYTSSLREQQAEQTRERIMGAVAGLTTPTYNVLLPLLAGIVTDRGGILSHPAIVSREFGIPGVVGAKNATALIPDGAQVEIDGDAGTVRILP